MIRAGSPSPAYIYAVHRASTTLSQIDLQGARPPGHLARSNMNRGLPVRTRLPSLQARLERQEDPPATRGFCISQGTLSDAGRERRRAEAGRPRSKAASKSNARRRRTSGPIGGGPILRRCPSSDSSSLSREQQRQVRLTQRAACLRRCNAFRNV